MPAQNDDASFRFEVQVGGEYRGFAFDPDVQKFSGAEALLVDRFAGDTRQWIGRLQSGNPTGADIVLVAFLAARRDQIATDGVAALDWDEFAEAVAPYTLRAAGEPTAVKPNRSDRRAATRAS